MARMLAGGCRVWALKEGRPRRLGRLKIWDRAGRRSGARAISLRVMELEAGLSPGIQAAKADDVLYVLEGRATVYLDGWPHAVGPETGLYVRPGTCMTIDNPGPGSLILLSSRCPDPGTAPVVAAPRTVPAPGARPASPSPLVRVADRPSETTGDRSYRVLLDRSSAPSAPPSLAAPTGLGPPYDSEPPYRSEPQYGSEPPIGYGPSRRAPSSARCASATRASCCAGRKGT